jgi:hypothetical protein
MRDKHRVGTASLERGRRPWWRLDHRHQGNASGLGVHEDVIGCHLLWLILTQHRKSKSG